MKVYVFLILSLFLSGVHAQSDLPVLIMEVGKGVKYTSGAGWTKLKTPGVASTAGQLKLGGKGRIVLYCNGDLQTIEGKGEYALSDTFREQQQAPRTDWEKTFNTFLTAAGNTGQGFAQSLPADNAPIQALSPVSGPVATFDLHFYWRTELEADTFQLEIIDPDGKTAYTAETTGDQATVDPRKARLFPGRDYSWRVAIPGQPEKASKTKTFQMTTLGQKSLLLPKLKEEKSYQEAEPFIQTLMEAAFFEKEGWYYDAHEAYRTLLEQEPDNLLYQQFYNAFLNRCGL